MIFILQQIKPNINLLLHKQIADFRIQDFILIFWNIREVTGCQTDQVGPLVGQFWFIQCLLVYTLLAPIIWYATQKLRMIFVIAPHNCEVMLKIVFPVEVRRRSK